MKRLDKFLGSPLFFFLVASLFTYLIIYESDFFPIPFLYDLIIFSTILMWFCVIGLFTLWVGKTYDNLKTKWYRYQAKRFERKLERGDYGK